MPANPDVHTLPKAVHRLRPAPLRGRDGVVTPPTPPLWRSLGLAQGSLSQPFTSPIFRSFFAMVSTHRPLRSALLVSAASLGLLAAAPVFAVSTEEAIRTATAACLDHAGKLGWRTDLAKVISSRSINADKVEVVFDLTRDGTNTARLTCPYSISQGVPADFGKTATSTADSATTAVETTPAEAADAGTPVNPGRAWWLLLPLGLGLLGWAALRGAGDGARDGVAAYSGGGSGVVTTGTTTSRNIYVEANAHDGELEVRDRADISSAILRRVRNGERIALTGHRIHDWLEVASGGWVRDIDVRYDRTTVRFS